MASIMKYIVNNANQLPTYCFAEESLMSDSRCKATSTEEMHEKVPLVTSKQTHQCCDGSEQHSIRPPPGFAPISEKHSLSNMSTRSFSDIYSFGSASRREDVKTSNDNAEVTTNPFLSDQQFMNDNVISNDIAKKVLAPIWNENLELFIKLTKLLYEVLKRTSCNKSIFENHLILQYHLNTFLKTFEKMLMLDNDQCTTSTSPTSLNLARETTPDNVGSVEKTLFNSNVESFVSQQLAGMSNLSLSNPFNDSRTSQTHNIFSTYGSNDYTNWHQPDGFSPSVQVSSPVTSTSTSVHSPFSNYGSSTATTNVFFPNADQDSENFSATSVPPVMNASVSNNNYNSSSLFSTVNNEFAKVFKETNPFKFSLINGIQIPEKENEQMANSHDANLASYLSVKNIHDHSLKKETVNVHAGNKGFTAAKHVNVNSAENYTPKIVYEAGPVMYNTQKNQTDVDVKHSACNSDFKKNHNVSLKKHCDNKELSSQSANDITTLYSKHSSHIDEGYVTRPPTDYTLQNSSIVSSESNYQQSGNVNEQIVSPQTWKQVEIPERWINSQQQNDTSLQNHKEKPTINTLINFSPHKNLNSNNKESVIHGTSGMADLNYIFQWNDKERPIDMYKNFCNNSSYIENEKSIEYKNAISDFIFDTSFVFQKIDLIKDASFIFHFEGEGWMLTHEFVESFTNLKLCSRLMAMLEVMNIKATFKEIQRSDYPVQFLQLDHFPLNVPRDCNKRIISINLISLQTALSLLHKLKIVTREEIDNAFKKNEFLDGSILPNMWTLIIIYRGLKQRIEQNKLWDI